MLILVAAVALQAPSFDLPARVYQPDIFDPGLDGGHDRWFSRGDFTPDGRLLLGYRRMTDPYNASAFSYALTASVVDPERMQVNEHGHLEAFYTSTGESPYGSAFALGGSSEWEFIHWGHEIDTSTEGAPGAFQASGTDYLPDGWYALDPSFPVSDVHGSTMPTLALKPLANGNPFLSDATGAFDPAGDYSTYEIWLVRLHSRGWAGHMVANAPEDDVTGALIRPPTGIDDDTVLVAQTVTVVLHRQTNAIVHTAVSAYQPLLAPEYDSSNDDDLHSAGLQDSDPSTDFVRCIEPSITADGQLIVFHGNGSLGGFIDGHANVTYIYNNAPCSATGWTRPRSITQLPEAAELDASYGSTPAAKLDAFKRKYRVFAQPIKMPPTSNQSAYTYGPADTVRGAYPWISKDGSFFTAACGTATEAVTDPPEPFFRTRTGNYVCGSLTGGYIKLIDDAGLNPTRRGGPMQWPPYKSEPVNSWRTLTFSTGEKPGIWEPLLGDGAPIPTQVASQRIPVMPMIIPEIDSYGEIRFEEVDGNYLLYLACNESLEIDPAGTVGEIDAKIEADSTPDTSGRSTRAKCSLNNAARFPQEVFANSAALRSAVGTALGASGPRHENLAFKGQGIVTSAEGRVTATAFEAESSLAGKSQFTVQGFVKVLKGSLSGNLFLFEHGGVVGTTADPLFTLEVAPDGSLVAKIDVDVFPGGVATKTATTAAGALEFGKVLSNPKNGWRHVAVTYDGTFNGFQSRLRVWLDGKVVKTITWPGTSTVATAAGVMYYVVGPGRSLGVPSAVTTDNAVFVFDEVAVSNVQRNGAELRRDAYVEPTAGAFTAWNDIPAGQVPPPALPQKLARSEARWPVGVDYDADVRQLGRDLFASNILSAANDRSCATCHTPGAGDFVIEDEPLPLDVGGFPLPPFNTPTLLNSAFGTHKTFSGKAASLEAQIVFPLTSGEEMGTQTMNAVVAELVGDTGWNDAFVNAFGVGPSATNLAQAIAMYLRLQNVGESPYDNELVIESGGLGLPGVGRMSSNALLGRALFFGKARCFTCHRGSSFTDDDFHNILSVSATPTIKDRASVTQRPADLGGLKTPTLRNVAQTGPWFHDGSKTSLEAVIEHYNDPFATSGAIGTADRDLRALGLSSTEISQLVAFLHALTSAAPPDVLTPP